MQKQQKHGKREKKKEREREREEEEEEEEEEMEMQAQYLTTSHRGWEASTMAVSIKKKKKKKNWLGWTSKNQFEFQNHDIWVFGLCAVVTMGWILGFICHYVCVLYSNTWENLFSVNVLQIQIEYLSVDI